MLPGLAEQLSGIRRTRARDLIEKRRAQRGYKAPRRTDALPQRSESISHMTAENRSRVRALAAQHGTVSVPIVRKALGINDSSTRRLLKKMAADGELERLPHSVGRGILNIYALPGQAQSVGLAHFVDPQEVANRTGYVVILDEDAANTGCCWWGVKGECAKVVEDKYTAEGGTVSAIYEPK